MTGHRPSLEPLSTSVSRSEGKHASCLKEAPEVLDGADDLLHSKFKEL